MNASPSSPFDDAGHIPVLLDPVIELLDPAAGQIMLDCTLGRGGHAGIIMPRLAPGGRYIGLDADPANLQFVREAQPDPPVPMNLIHRNFIHARQVLNELNLDGVDLLLADLGFASSQMADAQRGLSFNADGPLDMRLDPSSDTTAAALVNRLDERELADMIYQYGEERLSRRIARKIVETRRRSPIESTRQLAELCAAAYGPRGRRQRIDPATRTFQALRIAVNDELDALRTLLDDLPALLRPGGRAVIISFHSLEDRMVKHAFNDYARGGQGERLTKKPVTADEAERANNPRARSAKLRAIRWTQPLPREANHIQ